MGKDVWAEWCPMISRGGYVVCRGKDCIKVTAYNIECGGERREGGPKGVLCPIVSRCVYVSDIYLRSVWGYDVYINDSMII